MYWLEPAMLSQRRCVGTVHCRTGKRVIMCQCVDTRWQHGELSRFSGRSYCRVNSLQRIRETDKATAAATYPSIRWWFGPAASFVWSMFSVIDHYWSALFPRLQILSSLFIIATSLSSPLFSPSSSTSFPTSLFCSSSFVSFQFVYYYAALT